MKEQFHTASEIAQHMTEVLRTITLANGYKTDIGSVNVFRGRKKIDDDMVPCAVIVEGEDDVTSEGKPPNITVVQSYVVGGYSKCDPDHPNDTAHDIIKDLKRAFFKDAESHAGRNFEGRVIKVEYRGRDIGPRADGVAIVFAVIHIDVTYQENLAKA